MSDGGGRARELMYDVAFAHIGQWLLLFLWLLSSVLRRALRALLTLPYVSLGEL